MSYTPTYLAEVIVDPSEEKPEILSAMTFTVSTPDPVMTTFDKAIALTIVELADAWKAVSCACDESEAVDGV